MSKRSKKTAKVSGAAKSAHRPASKLTPPKSSDGTRTAYNLPVMVYFTKEQKSGLIERSKEKGLPLSTFIRERALAAA